MPISPEIIDGFWCSRCLNDRIDLSDMIGTFASSAKASLVAKNRTKKIIPLPLIESSPVDGFWRLKCQYNRINQPDIIGLFVGGTTTPLVVKVWTKQPWVKIEYLRNFDHSFAIFRSKIWLWLFYNFICVMVLRFYTKNLKSFRPKVKAWQQFFWILI